MRYFEDIAVGDTARFGSYPVDRDAVIGFARQYDPQPFHLSDEAAARTHFGRLAASGWHSCAMTMAMLVEHWTAHPIASLGAAGIDELRWRRPVYPGDTLSCETEVLSVRPSTSRPEMGSVASNVTVRNQDDQVVLTFISQALIATRAGKDAG